jgi:hypothetical protein
VKSEAQHRLTCWRIAAGPYDVEVRVLLAGEGGCRQVFRRRARSDSVGSLLAD